MIICHPYLSSKGGGERIVVQLAKHFDCPVYVADYKPENLWEDARNLDVHVIKASKPTFLGYRKAFGSLRLDTDVVNAQGHPSQWVRRHNKPVIWYIHFPPYVKSTMPIPPGFRWIEKRIIKDIEYCFCNSKYIRGKLKQYYNKDAEVLNPRADIHLYKPGKFQNYFFYPSRLHPRKRFEIAIEAINIVRQKYPDFRLVIAGFPSDESYISKINKMLGSSGEVIINPNDKRMKELYSNCYGVLYSAWVEDFGIVPVEGLASGKPVIAMDEGGPSEVVSNGKTGYLVKSASEMAKKMEHLIENKSLATKMGKEARRTAEKKYGWESFLDRFEEVYEEFI